MRSCRKLTNPVTKNPVEYYEVNIQSLTKEIYPNKKPAALQGYDGIVPGPTFMIDRGTETVVRFTNSLATTSAAIHLHGSPSVRHSTALPGTQVANVQQRERHGTGGQRI